MNRHLLARSAVALAFAVGAAAGCDNCNPVPPAASPCTTDDDCGIGAICRQGACIDPLPVADAGTDEETDAGEQPSDAGQQLGVLKALPEEHVEFGATRLGVAVDRTITLRNTGTAPLTVLQLVLDDNVAGTFSSLPAGVLDQELAPGADLGVLLTYVPNDGVPDSAALKVIHTGEGGLLSVSLYAEFKGTPALSLTDSVQALTPNVTALDFGDVNTGSSRTIQLFARNSGSEDSILAITAATMTPSAGPFSVVTPVLEPDVYLSSWAASCVALADCAPAAAACTQNVCVDGTGVPLDAVPVAITFAPTTPSPASATLTLASTDQGALPTAPAQADITLSGRGVAGNLVVTPSAVSFLDAYTGRTATRGIRVSNDGLADVTVETMELGGAFAFSQAIGLPYVLHAGDGFDVTISFTPPFAGQFTRTLTLTTASGDETTVDIVGNARDAPGVHALDANSLSDLPAEGLVFGATYTGTVRARQIAIFNAGTAGSILHVGTLLIEGPGAARFAVTPTSIDTPLPSAVNLQPRAPLTVNYLPAGVTNTDDTATLVVESDDPDMPALRIPLAGRSVQPVVAVDTDTIDFGPVLVGTVPSPTRTITIRNTGIGDLVVGSVTNPADGAFTVARSALLPAALAPFDGSITLTVTFTPTSAVFSSSSFVITTSDAARPTVTVALSGGGNACTPRAHASVTVIDNVCTYSCDGGFHACGDACLSTTSPDSCGDSCTPCASRTNTSRGCEAASSTCTYSCVAQTYDLDNDRSVPQGVGSDGCEYTCDVASPSGEQCNNLDDNCDGVRDNGLSSDGYDGNAHANDAQGNRTDLGTVVAGNTVTFSATLYPYPSVGGDDVDWYRINTVEQSCSFCCVPFWDDESFSTTFTLDGIAAGSNFDMIVVDEPTGTPFSFVQTGNNPEAFAIDYGGVCGETDDRAFLVGITRASGGSCSAYGLSVKHEQR